MTIAPWFLATLLQAGLIATPPAQPPLQGPPAAPPRIETRASFGFRLRESAYRAQRAGGAVVSTQLCRLPGWAGASIAMLRFEARHADGQVFEMHEAFPPRLAIGLGQNCATLATRFTQAPAAGTCCASARRMLATNVPNRLGARPHERGFR